MERHYKPIFGFWAFAFLLITAALKGQTPGGANGMVFRFTKQVWLNPTIILAKQSFEQSTNVKLLILPRVNGDDTTGSSRIEKAFDKLLSFLVYKENVQGSIKFYFNPKNPTKPFTFNTSDELHCKFTPIQKDSVETILNKDIVNSNNLNNFTALPFDSIINRASRYCKKILQSKPGLCGENPGNEFTLTKINSTPAKLNFEKGLNPNATAPNGGVDRKKYPELEQYYNTILDVADNSNYPMAWKAMAANTSDVIKLKLKKKQSYFDINKLVFKNANGTETYNVTYNNIGADSIIDLSISGKSPGSMAEVVAYYTPTTTPTQTFPIGAFNVQFYQPKTLNVVLVNIGGTGTTLPDATTIKNSLNQIYGQAFVSWNVTTANCPLPVSINKNIHIESSGLLSNYMPDMQPVVSYFKDNCAAYNSSSDDTYYLLFGATNDGDLLGYMPRARNTGFIFDTEVKTIAHELGHGAFNLKHIFSSEELGQGNLTQTNNLMDYTNNTNTGAMQRALYKHQWDLIHDPGSVSWFEGDDDDGAAVQVNSLAAVKTFSNTNGSYTFITPGGKYITLPKGVNSLLFSTLDQGFYANGNGVQGNSNIPFGALIAFKDEFNTSYSAYYSSNAFYGYIKENSNEYYTDVLTASITPSPQSGIAVFVGVKQGQFNYFAGKFTSASTTGFTDATNKGAGAIPNSLMIITGSKADLDKSLSAFLNSQKTSATIETVTDANYKILSPNAATSFDINGTNYSVEELTKLMLDENSTLHEVLSHFAFVNQGDQMLGFAECLDQQNSSALSKLKNIEKNAAAEIKNGTAPVYTNRESAKIEYQTVTTAELLKAAGNDTLLMHALRLAQTAEQIQQAFITHSNVSNCSLYGLSINMRINLLNTLIGNNASNSSYWFVQNNLLGSNEKFIVKYLIENTPQTDQFKLLNSGVKPNNYLWLRILWSAYNNTSNLAIDDLGELFSELSVMVANHISQLGIEPHTANKTIYTSILTTSQVTILPGLDRIFLIGKEKLEYSNSIFEFTQKSNDIDNYGNIHLYEMYTEDRGYSSILKHHVILTEEYDEYFSPFEPVTIKMTDYFYEMDNETGRELIVPAFMAMWYAKNVEKIMDDRIKRKIFNTVTIAAGVIAAPFSGGTSLAAAAQVISSTAAVASLADIYLSSKRESMDQTTYNQYKDHFEAWDKIKTTIDMADLSASGLLLTTKFITRCGSFKIRNILTKERPTFNTNLPPNAPGFRNVFDEVAKAADNPGGTPIPGNPPPSSGLLDGPGDAQYIKDFDNPNSDNFLVVDKKTSNTGNGLKSFEHKIGHGSPNAAYQDLLTNPGSPKTTPEIPGGGTCSAENLTEVITGFEAEAQTAVNTLLQELDLQVVGNPVTVKFAENVPPASPMSYASYQQTGTVQKYTSINTGTSGGSLLMILTKPNGQKKLIYSTQDVFDRIYQREKNKQQCKTCTKFDQLTCQKFETLKIKAGGMYPFARTKLCNNLTSVNVNSVLNDLNGTGFSIPQLSSFLNTLNTNQTNLNHMLNKIPAYDSDLLNAFKQMHAHKSSGYWADYRGLYELSRIMTNTTVKGALGGDAGVNDILEKNSRLPCRTCDTSLSKMYLNYMDEYLKDVKHFAENFESTSGYSKALGLLKSTGTGNKVEPEAFILRVLRSDNITTANGLEVALENCEPDLIKSDGTICEFKSWSGISPADDSEEDDGGSVSTYQTCFDRFASGAGAYGQFKNILKLASLSNLTKLIYYFDERKIQGSNKLAFVKGKFKQLLYDSSTNLLTTQGEEIFETIFNNTSLRTSLFAQRNENAAKAYFKDSLVSSTSSVFYDFIQLR